MINELKNIVNNNSKTKYYDLFLNKMLPKKYFISIIIPVRGRVEFFKPLITTLKSAIKKIDKKINITIVEHSVDRAYKELCKKNNVNYYWIKADKNEPFNKCLCHNIGAIINKRSEFYLFHDLDCLVFDNFFASINDVIISKNALAIQTFKNRRVLYLDSSLTNDIICEKILVNDINLLDNRITESCIGAPGGSILVNGDFFFNLGGFDPELFYGYSPEDRFFWTKMNTFTDVYSANNEVLHMFHERMDTTNDNLEFMNKLFNAFNNLSNDEIINFINFKKNLIIKYKTI